MIQMKIPMKLLNYYCQNLTPMMNWERSLMTLSLQRMNFQKTIQNLSQKKNYQNLIRTKSLERSLNLRKKSFQKRIQSLIQMRRQQKIQKKGRKSLIDEPDDWV